MQAVQADGAKVHHGLSVVIRLARPVGGKVQSFNLQRKYK